MLKSLEPFIGITCDVSVRKRRKTTKHTRDCQLICDYRYPQAVKQAGGFPILLPLAYSSAVVRRYLDQIDGLVIVGGDDVDPRLYGEKRRRGTGTVYGPRLYFERKLYKEALRRKLPILGVCYGMQLINVLEGGTLFQDIKRDAKSNLSHRDKKHPFHKVRLAVKSRLGKIFRRKLMEVHTDHHQAVSRVAPGFRPVAFAEDGIIEAIECDRKEILAVQWHPERMLQNSDTQRLFEAFVQLCLDHMGRKRRRAAARHGALRRKKNRKKRS